MGRDLLSLLAWVGLCTASVEDHLSAEREQTLPKRTAPPWWATSVPRGTAHHGRQSVSAGSVQFYDPQVEEWLKSSNNHHSPHLRSHGWRIVSSKPIQGKQWCARRVKFMNPAMQEVSGCQVVAPGADMLMDDFVPDNAFNDDASDGCSLKDSQTGLWYIGIHCETSQRVHTIELLQVTKKTSALHAKIQQLLAGSWMDVGDFVQVPVNASKVIFQAAMCHKNVCDAEHVIKSESHLPMQCMFETCSQMECCDVKDTCKTDTCVTTGWALIQGAKGTRCSGDTCKESFCCEKKGICLESVCTPKLEVLKRHLPSLCKGSTCQVQECCDAPICKPDLCLHAAATIKEQKDPPQRCKGQKCTVSECCERGMGQLGSAQCEQDVCSADTEHFRKDAFGKTCAAAVCTTAECCEQVLAPVIKWDDSVLRIPHGLGEIGLTSFPAGLVILGALGVLTVTVRARLSRTRLASGAGEFEGFMDVVSDAEPA